MDTDKNIVSKSYSQFFIQNLRLAFSGLGKMIAIKLCVEKDKYGSVNNCKVYIIIWNIGISLALLYHFQVTSLTFQAKDRGMLKE